jgi:sulfite exporter TauE/SafE
MHLVIIAWLFVIVTMALTMKSALAGAVLFVALGLGPVLLYFAIAMRRSRSRRERERGSQGPL